jgi:small conductance mechanosensitive channel
VRDVIGGIFIVFEDQFHIGDVLEFGNVVGTVENMTLRATQIRDDEGTLHIIPNDQLRVIANRTRGWSRATVDVTIPYTQDIEAVYKALDVVLEKAQAEESVSAVMLEELTVTGIEGLDNRGLRVGITGRTKPNAELEVQRFLRRQMMDVLTERQITVA